jgi:hypothetical protein
MLVYRQKKTQKQEYLPIAKPVLDIIDAQERKADTEPVFDLQGNKEVNQNKSPLRRQREMRAKK